MVKNMAKMLHLVHTSLVQATSCPMCPAEHMMCYPCAAHPYRTICDIPDRMLHWTIAWLTVPVWCMCLYCSSHILWLEGSVTFWWQSCGCNCSRVSTSMILLMLTPQCHAFLYITSSNSPTPGSRSYSDLVDTWTDYVFIHQLVCMACSKTTC